MEFGPYFERIKAPNSTCASVAQAVNLIANEDNSSTLVVLSDGICPPRPMLRLARDRKLVVALIGKNDESDCALMTRERQARMSFPTAVVVTAMPDSAALGRLLSAQHDLNNRATVAIQSCVGATPGSKLSAQTKSGPDEFEAKFPMVGVEDALRLTAPQPNELVAREVPFQGSGAQAGTKLIPFVKIRDEVWPQEPVWAAADGRFSGVVIAGRPRRDCGEVYDLRVYSQVEEQVSTGVAMGAWPRGVGSLAVKIVRGKECQ